MGGSLRKKGTGVPICRTIRIGLVGDPLSGKSSILTRFISNRFRFEYEPTTKNIVGLKSYILDEVAIPVTVEIWELHSDFNQPIDVAIIVIDSKLPINEIQDYYMRWFKEAQNYFWNDIHVALTKSELSEDEADKFVDRVTDALVLPGNRKPFLTSASSNIGIFQMFKTIISQKMRGL
ncbi:unnamed protein product [Blepharisma stoltei]|uniref:GTP-binding protein n=1 Tax=Blepharisma stoltei TaxID=1481888 RepID=A0AAU9K2R9_9CILI|nr:unnamed protein product [Blepharisma stoltei]